MNTKHNTMETMYRKVSLSERLPQKEKVYIGIINTIGEVHTAFYIGEGKFSCTHVAYANPENDLNYSVTHWLEETPSLEAENKELREMKFTLDDIKSFGKKCFYKGFEKCEKDDANSFTAWREESGLLLHELLNKER